MRVVITVSSRAGPTTRISRTTDIVRIAVETPVRRAPSTPPRPSHGLANLWVHPEQTGTCRRSRTLAPYDPASACATPSAAYNAANASKDSSTILIRRGDYSGVGFVLVGHRSSPAWIVFTPETRRQVAFKGIQLGVGPDGRGPSQGPDYVVVRNISTTRAGDDDVEPENMRGAVVLAGSTHIRLDSIRAGSHFLQGAKDIEILNGDFGPCRAGISNARATPRACSNNTIDHYGQRPITEDRQSRRILIQGNYYHDYGFGRTCFSGGTGGTNSGNPGCHWECMFLNGIDDLTIRGNTFRDCAIMDIFTEDTQGTGYENLVIENNSFGTPLSYPDAVGSYTRPDALVVGCKAGHPGYRNLSIRFNSFARNTGMDLGFDRCRSARRISVIGNIAAKARCAAAATYRHNVWNQGARLSGTCHATDVNIRRSTFPFYADDSLSPGPGSFVLSGRKTAADDRVPVDAGCAGIDQAGNRRGSGGRCDAGSHER